MRIFFFFHTLTQLQLRQAPVADFSFFRLTFVVLFFILLILFYLLFKSRKNLQKTLYTDALTGEPNYQAISKEIPALVGGRPDEYALIYLDIHHFKAINDTFGYDMGDQVLIATAASLRDFIDPNERVARVYADTFVMLLRYTSHEEFQQRLDKLSLSLKKLSIPGNDTINPLFCGGVYPLPEDFDSLDKACDRANYAKDSISRYFSNTFVFYDDVMRSQVLKEKKLESSMHSALSNREFIPYYQPKINTITEKVVGAEALIRWNHPEKGLLSPSEFLPFYEKNGFIVNIDLFIFEQVCRDMHTWLENKNQGTPVSVNFSRRHIKDKDLPKKLKAIADNYSVPTKFLEIEVTETEEIDSVDIAVDFVLALKEYGFSVSIDDYGTGYSSISFLQQLPLDALKLDRAFILNAMKSDRARDIMRYLIKAMHQNEIKVVCEGVETREQRDFIVSLNCRIIQGYFYSMPLPREDFEAYLHQKGVVGSDNLNFIPITNFELNRWQGAEAFLSETIPSWIVSCLIEEGFPIHYISPDFLAEMGYSELELKREIDGLFENWVHPEDKALLQENMIQHRNSRHNITIQYRLRKRNGDYAWIQEINKRILIDDGREAVFGVCTDISQIIHLQTEKNRLIDTIPGGVGEFYLLDEGPVIYKATERFYDVIGHSKEDMLELGNNLFHIIFEGDLECAKASIMDFLDNRSPFCEYTFRIRHKDGCLHWITIQGSVSHSSPPLLATVIVHNSDRTMQEKQVAEREHAHLELALSLTEQSIFEYHLITETVYFLNGFPACGIPKDKFVSIDRSQLGKRFVHPDDIEKLNLLHRKLVAGETRVSAEIRISLEPQEEEASFTWLRITLSTVFDEEQRPVTAVGVAGNIERQKHFEFAFLQEAQYRKAFAESSLMAYEFNLTKDTIHRVTGSRGFRLDELFTGMKNPGQYSEALYIATKVLVASDDKERFLSEMSIDTLRQLYSTGIFEKEIEYKRITLDGQMLWTSVLIYLFFNQLTGDVMGYTYHRDIHARKEMELTLMEQAARDPLTHLLNRTTTERLVQNFLTRKAIPDRIQAFFMLDLDRFKEINDTYGHLMGDKCLVKLAQLITMQVREKDIVSRMGGDEFAMLLKDLPNKEKALEIANKLAEAVEQIGNELDIDLKTSVSIGLSISPRHGTDFEQLYFHADAAMYEAKKKKDGLHIVMAKEI